MKTIKTLLADDHLIVREGLRALLAVDGAIEVVAEADNGREAVELTKLHKPEVVVMDIAMPILNGIEAGRQIHALFPGIKIVILSAHSDDAYIDRAVEIGAAGFLVKQTSAQILGRTIKLVASGETYFSPSISRRIESGYRKKDKVGPLSVLKPNGLTTREQEVIQLVAEGQANKQVASALNISIKTVEKHRQNLMDKLNIHDTAGLTRYAIAAGIIESSVQVTIV